MGGFGTTNAGISGVFLFQNNYLCLKKVYLRTQFTGEIMKKLLICLAATAAVCSAQAQSGDFTGFSAGGNLAMNAAGVTASNGDGFKNDGVGQQSIGLGAFATYGFSVGGGMLLSLGFDYSLSDLKVQEYEYTATSAKSILKIQNVWSLSIAPGTMLTDKTLAYAKLGFEKGTAFTSSNDIPEPSKSLTGTSWGFGMKTFINKGTFLQVEAKQTNFGSMKFDNSSTDNKFRATTGSVGLGFMF
jgi:opacity protein-like surface antigen